MDSYDFGRYLGRPASPPLPDGYSGDYLPQMPAYRDTSPSGRSSGVPQPIDFGGSASGYRGASQSRHTSVPQFEYGSASQRTSSRGQRTSYTPAEKYAMVTNWRASGERQADYARRAGIPPSSFCVWIKEAGGSSQNLYAEKVAERQSKVVRDWRDSGETRTDYAKRKNIPITTFRKWIKKYEG